MQRSALRSIYGNTHPKAKHGAVVSPVLDNSEQDDGENPSWSTPSDDDDSDGVRRATRQSNNRDSDNHHQLQPHIELQKTSGQIEMPQLRTVSSATSNNQEHDYQPWSSGSTQSKYTVLGQKKLWRKSRAQRPRHTAHTILSVEDDDNDDSSMSTTRDVAPNSNREDVGDAWPSSRSSSSLSSYFSVNERLQAVRNGDAFRNLPGRIPSTARSSDSFSSLSSSCAETADVTQRFVVARQKKSKFAARVLLPGQKNPLYLGRYVSEAAALAACERAYNVIMTPHSAEKQ
uniref:Uncharacterized protein n=1 Tax=Globisporangium ultimum (strain ATCC 200006 / CBS 805.95 / DAOM BR144) TaxID=431595 RepID=K3WMG7_GLOUD